MSSIYDGVKKEGRVRTILTSGQGTVSGGLFGG